MDLPWQCDIDTGQLAMLIEGIDWRAMERFW